MITRTQQQVAMLVGLTIVMAAVYARAFRSNSRRHPAPTASVPAAADAPVDRAPVEDAWPDRSAPRSAQQAEAVQLAWARDPFTHGGTSSGGPAGLSLSGILWDASAPLAIINGQTLRVGDELDSFRVMQIDPDRVVLSDGVETFSLTTTP